MEVAALLAHQFRSVYGEVRTYFRVDWLFADYQTWETFEVVLEAPRGYRELIQYARRCSARSREHLFRRHPELREMVADATW